MFIYIYEITLVCSVKGQRSKTRTSNTGSRYKKLTVLVIHTFQTNSNVALWKNFYFPLLLTLTCRYKNFLLSIWVKLLPSNPSLTTEVSEVWTSVQSETEQGFLSSSLPTKLNIVIALRLYFFFFGWKALNFILDPQVNAVLEIQEIPLHISSCICLSGEPHVQGLGLKHLVQLVCAAVGMVGR